MIIGISGPMGVGKSTALEVLKSQSVQQKVMLVKFAAPIYEIQDYIYDTISPVYSKPKDFIKDRKLLQWLGSDWGRSLDQNLWVKLWKYQAEYSLKENHIVFCDDVRFDNEAETVKSLGGVIIQLSSTKIGDRTHVVRNGITNHISEAGIDKKYVDYSIINDNTLEVYKSSLKELFNKLLNKEEK